MIPIGSIIKFITEKSEFVLGGLFVAALVFGVIQCDRKQYFKAEEQKQRKNIEALNDSVTYYENRAGELTAQKQAFQTDVKQLKTLNDSLYKELKKEKDKVDYISQITANISSDTTEFDSTSATSTGVNAWRFNWNLSRRGDGWQRILEGYTFFKIDDTGIPYDPNTILTRDILNMQLVTGIRDVNGRKKIFVRSTYPNIQFTQIQGAIIDQGVGSDPNKPSRFGIGFNVGGSLSADGTIAPTLNVGLNWNLIRF